MAKNNTLLLLRVSSRN